VVDLTFEGILNDDLGRQSLRQRQMDNQLLQSTAGKRIAVYGHPFGLMIEISIMMQTARNPVKIDTTGPTRHVAAIAAETVTTTSNIRSENCGRAIVPRIEFPVHASSLHVTIARIDAHPAVRYVNPTRSMPRRRAF
jgi:hypothetical protein